MWWSCADSRDFDGTHDYALHQLNLEVVCAAPLRTLGRERCRASKRRRFKIRTRQGRFDPRDAPWLGSNAAESDMRFWRCRPT